MFETLVEIWPEKVKNFEHKNILRIEKYFKFPVKSYYYYFKFLLTLVTKSNIPIHFGLLEQI